MKDQEPAESLRSSEGAGAEVRGGPELLSELDREKFAAQMRLSDTARRVVRRASGNRSLDHLLRTSQSVLVEGFRAMGMWIQIFDASETGTIYSADGQDVVLGDRVREIAFSAAHALWDAQQTLVVDAHHRPHLLSADDYHDVAQLLDALSVGSLLVVPLGAGHECLGNLVLTRAPEAVGWTESEAYAALDVGRDLGAAILNVRAFEREHLLVTELQALDAYKSQIVATVSHELKNPLTSVLGHLEILESIDGLPRPVRQSIAAMGRGATRLHRIVDDLLLLAKAGDPNTVLVASPVDLRAVVGEVVDLGAVEATRRRVAVMVESPPGEVIVSGESSELDRVVSNLVSNAVKFTGDGGSVVVSLAHQDDQVVLSVTDTGIGISEDDRKHLFTEFFRSTNPAAVAQPGTGLGLTIVDRIVKRHHGSIELDSQLGVGTTFRVTLPTAT